MEVQGASHLISSCWAVFGLTLFRCFLFLLLYVFWKNVCSRRFTHLFRADGSGKGHAARPLPTWDAVAKGIVD